MAYKKAILCLANSRKPGGHCVAGLEIQGQKVGRWVRPVSSRPSREISDQDEQYRDGSQPTLLDVIEIEFVQPMPDRHQQENHQIDDRQYWTKLRSISWNELNSLAESISGPLWLNGFSSTYGNNDRVPEAQLGQFNRSLYLVQPTDLELIVQVEGAQFGDPRRRVRARFTLAGNDYILGVTDEPIEDKYKAKPDGTYRMKDALLCVSLGEVFHGYAYKLATAIFTPQRAGR